MDFFEEFRQKQLPILLETARNADASMVDRSLDRLKPTLHDFACLVSERASDRMEVLANLSHQITRRRFGKVIRMFAPLYLSNECINNCSYCSFSRDNSILRVTLTQKEIEREAESLKREGFRNILLVAGEHPKFISQDYLQECVRTSCKFFPAVSLEVGPMDTEEYRNMVTAGAEGLVVYQETYDRDIYSKMHTSGPKKDFDFRLATPERAYNAGFRRLGIGVLFGLSDWRYEALCLAAHVKWLLKKCWKSHITISFPRLRPNAGEFEPLTLLSDRDFVQLTCAFRILFPDVGIVLSTREPVSLRNGLMPLGITMMSAGSHTEPGGYTGAGSNHLHQTKNGRIVDEIEGTAPLGQEENERTQAGEQFAIADHRSPTEVANAVRRIGYEPVWKDWDPGFLTTT